MKIPIETSARHVHLSEKDFKKLFGERASLKPLRELSQPGEFASDKTITLINKNKKIENIRVVGPLRKNSQVEISITDSFKLKLKPKIKLSGHVLGAPTAIIKGPKGEAKVKVINAQRHLHISESDAKKIGIKNNQKVSVRVKGIRDLTFNNIATRVSKDFKTAIHIDTDESNAAGISGKTLGEIIK